MSENEYNQQYYEFEKAYFARIKYENLLANQDKNEKEIKKMEQLYEAIRIEAPYYLDFYD